MSLLLYSLRSLCQGEYGWAKKKSGFSFLAIFWYLENSLPLLGVIVLTIVLNGAKIGKNCLVGAGALVTEGKEFPDGSLIIGSPAKAVKNLNPEQIAEMDRISSHYVDNAKRYRNGLKKIA